MQAIRKPLPPPPTLPPQSKSKSNTVHHSPSNISSSSHYSYDNIDENEEYTVDIHGRRQRPLPPTPIDYLSHTKPMEIQLEGQGDTASTTSAHTLRTESYRQAHPLQSFAFDYPKQSRNAQTSSTNPNGSKKQYEISV